MDFILPVVALVAYGVAITITIGIFLEDDDDG